MASMYHRSLPLGLSPREVMPRTENVVTRVLDSWGRSRADTEMDVALRGEVREGW